MFASCFMLYEEHKYMYSILVLICWLSVEVLVDFIHLKFSDTENELTVEVGGYEHVKVLRNIKVVDGDAVETLQELPQGTVFGDCILKFTVFFVVFVSLHKYISVMSIKHPSKCPPLGSI